MGYRIPLASDVTRCTKADGQPGGHIHINGNWNGEAMPVTFQFHELLELREVGYECALSRRMRVLLRLYFAVRDAGANTFAECRAAWAGKDFEI